MRIVTYNTRGSLGMDGRRSTLRIVDVIRALSADIICFQEIHRLLPWSGNEDQPSVLEMGLNRTFIFQPNLHFGFGGYGIGVAVRGRVDEIRNHLLPSGKEQRGALEVRLRDIGGYPKLTVFCTHFGLDTDERVGQTNALTLLVRTADGPTIVCGDLNEGSDGAAVKTFVAQSGLIDADANQNKATFVSDNPTVRIDYVLHTADLCMVNVEAVPSLASDHLPLLVDFA